MTINMKLKDFQNILRNCRCIEIAPLEAILSQCAIRFFESTKIGKKSVSQLVTMCFGFLSCELSHVT